MDDRIYSHLYIRTVVNNDRGISRANTDSRFARGICGFDHAGAAGSQDTVSFLHYLVSKLQRRYVDPADNSFRCPCLYSCFQHNSGSLNGTSLGAGMGADNNGISCFQTNKGLKNGSRSRVGGWDNRSDQSQWFCDLFDSVCRIFIDNTAGLCVFIGIVHILCSIMVFDYFVLDHTHTCLLHSHFG